MEVNSSFKIPTCERLPFRHLSVLGVCRTPKFRNYATALSGALLRLINLPFKLKLVLLFYPYLLSKPGTPVSIECSTTYQTL